MNPWDVPIGDEHPDHPGWWRQGGDGFFAAFALAGSTIVVAVDHFETMSGVDPVAEMARLVRLGEEAHNLRKQVEATTSDEPRALTVEEMRAMFLGQVHMMVAYWADPDRCGHPAERNTRGYMRHGVEGFAHSLMVTLDGGSGGLPAFDLVPSPHPDDEAFARGEGENWWPAGVVINECQLHELLWRK